MAKLFPLSRKNNCIDFFNLKRKFSLIKGFLGIKRFLLSQFSQTLSFRKKLYNLYNSAFSNSKKNFSIKFLKSQPPFILSSFSQNKPNERFSHTKLSFIKAPQLHLQDPNDTETHQKQPF